MTTNVTERKTTAADPWAQLKVPVGVDEFGLGRTALAYPDVIECTASDYDEGGNNSVTISVPCRRGAGPAAAAELEKNIAAALDMAREHLLNYLSSQRKKEKASDKIIRFLRREGRYLLSRTKV